jgi:peptidoglycan-N-acetylglucosamine deacetylase
LVLYISAQTPTLLLKVSEGEIVVLSDFKLRRLTIVLVTVAFAAALLFVVGGTPSQAQKNRAVTITQLDTSRKVVALTFDAGSDAGYASRILNTLKAKGVKASFGMTGQWAKAHPALLRRIVREGHTVMNHTYSHPSFTGYSTGTAPLSYKQRVHELRKTESVVRRIAGASTKPYFRPPYGDYDASVLADVYTRGYRYNVMWSTDSLGWNGYTKKQILQRVLAGRKPGAVYLFHVGSESQDGPALQSIISELRRLGYGFVTINKRHLPPL